MSMFGNSAGTNPLFGGKPASAIFGNPSPQTNLSINPLNTAVTPSTNPLTAAVTPSTNPLTAAVTPSTNPLTAAVTPPNQPSGSNIFGSTSQQTQQQPATSSGIFGNTGSNQQPTSNIFGSTTIQQPASGGLFGNTSTTQPATSGGIFGNTSNQQPQQPVLGGGLFTTNQQQQPSSGGGLFGSTTQQPAQQSGTTSFGNTGTSGSQTGTSSFGSTGGGTSLFGNTGISGQQTGSSLFGSTNATNQPQTSLFGKPSTGTSSIFGSMPQQQQQQQQQQPPSLFGSTTQPAQSTGGFGTSSLFGKPATSLNQSALAPSNQQAQPGQFSFTKTTKFNDLPDNIKQLLEGIDSHIQGRVQISKDLNQRKLGEEPTKGQEMVRQMQKDFLNVSNVIRSDLRQTEDLKSKVDQAVQDTIVASRIIDAFRSAQSGTTYLKDHAGFPLEFFQRVTQQMIERLAWYKTTIEQIERRLSSSASQVTTPQSITATLQAQNATFLALASKTAALEAELQKIKVLYTQLWRTKTGSVRDPFIDGENLSFGS